MAADHPWADPADADPKPGERPWYEWPTHVPPPWSGDEPAPTPEAAPAARPATWIVERVALAVGVALLLALVVILATGWGL